MIDEPKTFNVPGIDTPLREQTLAEYVLAIPDKTHLVHRELAELQRSALRLAQLEAELELIRQENQRFLIELETVKAQKAAPRPIVLPSPAPKPPTKAACPLCNNQISTHYPAWARHMTLKHNLNKDSWPPCPQ
jgi:hypothetical protein